MGAIEEMLLKNGIIKFGNYRISGAIVSNNLCVYDASGKQTHRVEAAVIGGGTEAVVYDIEKRRTVMRIKMSATAA
ncbi:hypothetical protein IJI55_00475 [Candidatus Saccharibacteria bacterium]|nr:hypothetical protein [Candidatus Saccharibacteria bacterium]MBR0403015.1 hypothetical protein [Candidatus Saccharibacteria bacterium]